MMNLSTEEGLTGLFFFFFIYIHDNLQFGATFEKLLSFTPGSLAFWSVAYKNFKIIQISYFLVKFTHKYFKNL